MKSLLTLTIAALLLALSGCRNETETTGTDANGAALTPVTLQLNWFPETEHGGYYHAQLAGIYAEHGLEVTILKGGPNTPVEVQTGAGRVEFGIVNADKILSTRAEGVPLVGLLAPFQISPRCIIVHADSPIGSLAELRETTLIANHTKPFIKFLEQKHGLEGVRIIPYKGGMAQFLANPGYAIQGYVTSEPLIIEQQGVQPRSFLLADEGYNPYTSVLVTSEKMIAERPELVRAMVEASRKGWEAYLAEPAGANAVIQQRNPEMDDATLAYGAEALKPLMRNDLTAEHGFGWMTEQRWRELLRQLVKTGVVDGDSATLEGAWTTRFLTPAE